MIITMVKMLDNNKKNISNIVTTLSFTYPIETDIW